jgi:hypothetical protein
MRESSLVELSFFLSGRQGIEGKGLQRCSASLFALLHLTVIQRAPQATIPERVVSGAEAQP